jgi:hypothetical protein
MKLSIDPEFQSLISLLTPEERAQLETNLLAEGCCDSLAVWAGEPPDRICTGCPPGTPVSRATADIEAENGAVVWRCHGCGHIEHRPWTILDGHTRYPIVTSHGLPFEIREVTGVRTRVEAMKWIIDHQFGRRNLSEEQKSYLRGLRYNLEKQAIPNRQGNNQHREVEDHRDPQPTTAARLALVYQVGEATIKRDGLYAEAVDTLTDALGPEVRHEVLAGRRKLPKHTIVKRAKSLQRLKHRLHAKDYSFVRGLAKWQQQDALAVLTRLPADEHALVNGLLDQPGLSAKEILDVILRPLPAQPPDVRQRIYALHASVDPRDRARALREAAGDTPILLPPLRYLKFAGAGLQRAAENVDQCLQLDPMAPWSARLQALLTQIQALQGAELAQVVAEVEAYFEGGPEADVPADEIVDEAEDRDGTVDHSMPEVEVPAEETVDEANDRDGAVDQDIPELDVEHENPVSLSLTSTLEPALDSESQVLAEVESEVPPCDWCWSGQTWRAKTSGRIHCDDCHAVYNPATGRWDPGERAKQHPTPAPAAGLV